MPVIADIVKIDAPASAVAGGTVSVDVNVKNISTSDQLLTVTAVYDSTYFLSGAAYATVLPGKSVTFRGSFIMPSKNVGVWAWSWYWDGSKWVNDDTMYKDIALDVGSPVFDNFAIGEYVKV